MRNPNLPQTIADSSEHQDPYLDHFVTKARVRLRRIADHSVRASKMSCKPKHWANHTGAYKDAERMKGPKFWDRQKPVIIDNPIRSHKDLIAALSAIASGDRSYSQYPRVTGINRERLRLAESWRDKKIPFTPSDIIGLGRDEIRKELDLRL